MALRRDVGGTRTDRFGKERASQPMDSRRKAKSNRSQAEGVGDSALHRSLTRTRFGEAD